MIAVIDDSDDKYAHEIVALFQNLIITADENDGVTVTDMDDNNCYHKPFHLIEILIMTSMVWIINVKAKYFS